MKKILALIIVASILSITASAATPLYKPVKLPTIKITVPHYDFSYAVEQYLKEHPVTKKGGNNGSIYIRDNSLINHHSTDNINFIN